MAKKGITYDEVVACAEALLEEGIKITAENVREELGFRGSYTTIYKYLKRWMDKKLKGKSLVQSREKELNSILEEQAKRINQLEAELLKKSTNFDDLQQKNIELKNHVTQISKDLLEEKKKADQYKLKFETLQDSLDSKVIALTNEKEKSIIRLERELKNVYERFTVDFDKLRDVHEDHRVKAMVEIDSLKTENLNFKKDTRSYSKKYEDLLLATSREKARLKETINGLLEEKSNFVKEISELSTKLESEKELRSKIKTEYVEWKKKIFAELQLHLQLKEEKEGAC